MNIHFLKSSQKKELVKQLDKQFGIAELPYLLIASGKEKLRAFSGHLSKDEIRELSNMLNIELIGLYLIKQEQDLRLSLDATILLKKQINKNIINLTDSQVYEWLRGHDLDIKIPQGTLVIQHNDDFLGCGKSNGEKLFNYLPKDRRLRK